MDPAASSLPAPRIASPKWGRIALTIVAVAALVYLPTLLTERSIFQFLKLRYVEPRNRVDGNQIQPQKLVIPKVAT